MSNTVTDKLNFVTTSTVTGGMALWAQMIRADDGFSLQIFSAAGARKGVVTDKAVRMHLGHGDTMLRVNLGQRLFSFAGELITKDRSMRDYRSTVVLQVSDPTAFAICYRQDCDPVLLVQRAMQGRISHWAQGVPYREIISEEVRRHIEEGAAATQCATGISLVRIEECVVTLSKHSLELQSVRQNDEIARAHREFQDRRHQEALTQKNNEAEAARTRFDLDARMEDTIAGRRQIFSLLMQTQQQRLQKYLEQGATWEDIKEHDPEMFEMLTRLFAPPGESHPGLPTLQHGASSEAPHLDIANAKGLSNLLGTNLYPIWEPRLGVNLLLVELTPEQWHSIDAHRRTARHALRVIELDAAGPAASAGLQHDDIIIQINNQRLGSDETITMRLDQNQEGTAVSISILRGKQLLSIDVALAT